MFDTSGAGDEGWGTTPPPPAADRLWRHPSELGPATAPPLVSAPQRTEHRPHRFSLGTVVVASSLGALAMFGTLAATGLVGGVATDPEGGRPSGIIGAATDVATASTTTPPPGVVSVRVSSAESTTFGAGIVFNSAGDIVTTLPTTDLDGSPTGTVSVEIGDSAWGEATVVGADAQTGLTVLHPIATGNRTTTLVPSATVGAPSLGQAVDLVRPGLGAIGARFRSGTATRITSTNATLGSPGTAMIGLLTLTSARPATATEVGVDRATGDVTALVVPADDNPEDEMSYAVPADLAITIGRQIEATGAARHGALDADLVESPTDGLVITAARSTSLVVGDELLSVDGRTVHTNDDVLGVLLGTPPGDAVTVVVRRDNRQRSVNVDVAARIGDPLATTTTLP